MPKLWRCATMLAALGAGAVIAGPAPEAPDVGWPQWGGPARDFTVETTGLADKWPSSGPRQLWKREIGDGYSAIVAADGMLYTMCRNRADDQRELTIALDAATGKTVWRHEVKAPITTKDEGWGGLGPNSTPLIVDDRLYTIGSRAAMHCFDRRTGRVLWTHDLHREFDATLSDTVGYSNSPIAYRNLVIALGGCLDSEDGTPACTVPALMAFEQETGEVVWRSVAHPRGFSSPILLRVSERDLVVFNSGGGVVVIDPNDGQLLWQQPAAGSPLVTPVWNGSDLIYWSPGSDKSPARVDKLSVDAGKVSGEEVYLSRKGTFAMATPVRVGDLLVGSTQQNLVAIDFNTGRRAWIARGFPMATCLYADGKLIIHDENGRLTLATATPKRLTKHSQFQVTERYSLSVPTLVGTTLYVRDRKHIMALDLAERVVSE